MTLTLAGCAGERLSVDDSSAAASQTPSVAMAGRWMLSAPNAAYGMNFGGARGAHEGSIAPEEGCPGKFFTSRHWTLAQNALTINDHENMLLAHLKLAGGRFKGQSTAGTPVTLAR
jgi:hypothetical protein